MASLLERIFGGVTKNNSQTTAEAFNKAIYNYLGESLIWNPENDDSYINKGYRHNSTIYSIINLITKAATTVPFQVYEVQRQSDLKRYKALTGGELNTNVLSKAERLRKSSMVELEGTELHQILERPNPAQSFNSFLTEIIAFGKLTGNRYIYGIKPDTGMGAAKYKELYVLPSQVVEINSGGLMQPVKDYTIDYNGSHRIPAECVMHIKDFNPFYDGTGSHLYGMSPLRAGLRSMQANNEALTTGVKYLQNQTARGVLMSEEGDLNEVQARQLKDKFKQQYQGSENAGDVIITPKKLSWVNFGLNASDLSLLEQYDATIKDLCNIYNVPVQLLNNTSASTYNNQKEAKKALYQNAVIPEMVKIREELNRWLSPMFGEKLYIDFDFTVIPELQEEMDQVVTQMSNSWWLTPNEKRAATGYGVDDENPELDKYYIPANLIPVTDSEDLPQEPQEPKEAAIDYFGLMKSRVEGAVDMFTSIREAQERAEELGGTGYHSHIFRGSTVYMPFASHEEYEARVRGELFEYDHEEYVEETLLNKVEISQRVEAGLKKKVADHNEKHGDDPAKKVTYSMLVQVFKRGVGAYNTNPQSVRPTVTSADQWAYARCNSFLYCLRNGKFRGGKHDTDLLPTAHPMSTKKSETIDKNETYKNYPQGATNNARRMLEWRDKYGRDEVRGGTAVGWTRASQLANREALSLETVKRVHSFLSRHKDNAKIDPQYKGEPWKDKGYVAYNLWGGQAMVAWAKRISENN
jgi:HK97 family phage portal protein